MQINLYEIKIFPLCIFTFAVILIDVMPFDGFNCYLFFWPSTITLVRYVFYSRILCSTLQLSLCINVLKSYLVKHGIIVNRVLTCVILHNVTRQTSSFTYQRPLLRTNGMQCQCGLHISTVNADIAIIIQ